ncbi:MAG: chromosome segregation protein SMC [Lachnospiraceae bacterium]|nr:chromosome segregation protein SMC [Lachnospiraceae bacterium]
MYLKGIEVQGFKSFANRMKFDFHNGITCIVGPNGSGKSNVADAVRWVLGEQSSKSLRGSNMQDVIFAGTETRKPQGFAGVSLILDNSDRVLEIDYDEVSVTRRLYRSGESEYLINGNTCRLRDIYELFYDTGIGKEGYSIIGQGQIERILSSKPEDRRELFDEAAGIVKYKHRKNDALKKLNAEQANMERVSDVMNELERRVGPLARQSETAKNYLKLRDELKEAELSLFAVEHAEYEKQSRELEEKLAAAEQELADARSEEEALHEKYESVLSKVSELEQEMSDKKEEASRKEVQLQALSGQISLAEEQIRSEEKTRTGAETRIARIDEEIASREKEEREQFASIVNLSKEITEKNEELKEAEQKLKELEERIAQADEEIATGKEKIIALLSEQNDNSVKLQHFDTMQDQALLRIGEWKSESERLVTVMQEAKEAFRKVSAACEEKRKQEADCAALDAKMAEDLKQLSARLENLNIDMENAQKSFQNSTARAESLKNLAERYEGYGHSVRKIMEVKESYPGIHGVVADLISVEGKYETAIETALGGAIQNVVTTTENDAKNLIAYLKKNHLGRATFLPLNAIRAQGRGGITPEVLKEPGALGIAAQLVKADPQYASVLEFLLGRVLVVDGIDQALKIARKYQHSLRIVTLEGEQLNPGGSLSGGAYSNSSNLLGRKREIEELEKHARAAEKQYEKTSEERRDVQEQRASIRASMEENRKEREQLTIAISTLNLEMLQHDKDYKAAEEKNNELLASIRETEESLKQMAEESTQLRKRLEEIESENRNSETAVKSSNESIDTLRSRRTKAAARVSALSVETAQLTEKEAYCQERRERLSQEIEVLEHEKENLEDAMKGNSRNISGKKAQIDAILKTIEEGRKQIEGIGAEAAEIQKKRDDCVKNQKNFFDQTQELSERIRLLSQEQVRLSNQLEKTEEKNTSSVEHLWNEYDMTPSEAIEAATPMKGSLTENRKHIAFLKDSIRKLGNVNVNAIEEFKEVSERYTFMKAQYDDLIESERAIAEVIEELEKGMREQFTEQFARIREEFNKAFKELFGGGNADLELVEEEDVIEAGIRINAQPPGKKLQNMMQLSGGEKALTAIALLFAIQNLKPSPFCLLDEVEAALDDSNVGRYAQYLKTLTEHTQFIVITHRRGTMAAADRLYGITMQEKGVSTLVSVNMVEEELSN